MSHELIPPEFSKNFDFNHAREVEKQRLLRLFEKLLKGEVDNNKIHEHADTIGLTFPFVMKCLKIIKEKGADALVVNLPDLDEKSLQKALEKVRELGDAVNNEFITDEDIEEIARRNGWSERKAEGWVLRYRAGGLWGVSPHGNPFKDSGRANGPAREMVAFSEKELKKIYKKYSYIEPLLELDEISDTDVIARAEELKSKGISITPRTLWTYIAEYRVDEMAGLGRKDRSDKGVSRAITEQMVEIIHDLRLSGDYKTNEAVHIRACEIARELGEPEPKRYKVDEICSQIPRVMRDKADGKITVLPGADRPTQILHHKGVIIQIDSTIVDVLTLDKRKTRPKSKKSTRRKKQREVRLWLILALDSKTRKVIARKVSYHKPDRYSVGSLIRQVLLAIGIPNEIWLDRGKEFMSTHIRLAAKTLRVKIRYLPPRRPQLKGKVERFFGTLRTRVWRRLPGYVGPNPAERPPEAKAELTPTQLVKELDTFIERYNNEVHSVTHRTPNEFWEAEQHQFTLPVDPRDLDILLLKTKEYTVHNRGIKYRGEFYGHSDLATLIGEKVIVRVEPYELRPEELEVFYDDGNGEKWFCTAYWENSERGLSVPRREQRHAQQQRTRSIAEALAKGKKTAEKFDKKAEKTEPTSETPPDAAATSQLEQPVEDSEKTEPEPKKQEPKNDDPWTSFPIKPKL